MLERRLVVSTLAITSLILGCAPAPSASPDPLAGTYAVKGGGAALEVFQALSDAFRTQHPKVHFDFEDIGSAAGMKLAASVSKSSNSRSRIGITWPGTFS